MKISLHSEESGALRIEQRRYHAIKSELHFRILDSYNCRLIKNAYILSFFLRNNGLTGKVTIRAVVHDVKAYYVKGFNPSKEIFLSKNFCFSEFFQMILIIWKSVKTYFLEIFLSILISLK